MKATSHHSGFGILVVVVLAIIVGLGYVFINRPSSKPDSATSTSSQASAETSSIQGDLDSMNIDATLDTTDIDSALNRSITAIRTKRARQLPGSFILIVSAIA